MGLVSKVIHSHMCIYTYTFIYKSYIISITTLYIYNFNILFIFTYYILGYLYVYFIYSITKIFLLYISVIERAKMETVARVYVLIHWTGIGEINTTLGFF